MRTTFGRPDTGPKLLALLLLVASLIASTLSIPAVAAPVPDANPDFVQANAWLDLDGDGVNDPDEPSANHLLTGQLLDVDGNPWDWSVSAFPFNTWIPSDTDRGPFTIHLNISGATLGPAGPDQDASFNGTDVEVTNVQPGEVYQIGLSPLWNVSLGRYGGGVIDGQAPFGTDPDSVCPGSPQPGDDCAADNGIIRGGNTVGYRWAVSAAKADPSVPTPLSTVYLIQNVVPDPGVRIDTGNLPSACVESGSSVERKPDGSVQLFCNLGTWTESGTAKLFRWNMRVLGGTNGTGFTSTAYVTAAPYRWDIQNPEDPTNPVPYGALVAPSEPITDHTTISSGFKFDLEKRLLFQWGTNYRNINGENLRGSGATFLVGLSSPLRSNSFPDGDFTFTEDAFFSADGDADSPSPLGDIEHYITCNTNGYWSSELPFGYPQVNQSTGVADGGTCELVRQGGGNTGPYTVTLKDLKIGGPYPTKTADGSGDLSNGPFYSGVYAIEVFVPDRAVVSLDDPANAPDQDSTMVYNRLADFDPVSVDGQQNYAGQKEPGWCDGSVDPYSGDFSNTGCSDLPGGAESNNVAHAWATVSPVQRNSPYITKTFIRPNSGSYFPGSNFWHDGLGRISAGEGAYSQLSLNIGDSVGWKNYGVCDVWDNSTLKLVPANQFDDNQSAGTYAYESYGNPSAITSGNTPNWIFRYGHYDNTGVDQLYNSSLTGSTVNSPLWPTTNTYDTSKNHFLGDWGALKNAVQDCRQSEPTGGWFTDPNDVPGGIDEVNAVSIVPDNSGVLTTDEYPIYFGFNIPLRARTVFQNGPYAGQNIPADTLVPNYSGVWGQSADDDVWFDGYTNFSPAPFQSSGDGDQIAFTRGSLDLTLDSVEVNESGNSVSIPNDLAAGKRIIWESRPSLSQGQDGVQNMVVTQTLPLGVLYDPTCTGQILSHDGGTWTPATSPQVSTDILGRTVLTWNLGDRPPGNHRDPVLRSCVSTDPLTPDQTTFQISSTVSADGIQSVTREHIVTLTQTNELALGKYLSKPAPDVQNYTLTAKNFSDSTDFNSPGFIEVFPYNGDKDSPDGIRRGAGSDFNGTLTLMAEPTAIWSDDPATPSVSGQFSYSADAPGTIAQSWSDNTSTWCTLSGASFTRILGNGACPADLTDVTAIRFEGSETLLKASDLDGDRSEVSIDFSLQMAGFQASDRYHDKFTFSSPSITKPTGDLMVLESNTTVTSTPGFTVGNVVFLDVNGNDRFDSGTDAAIPGVEVRVWSAGTNSTAGDGDDYLIGSTTTDANGTWKLRRVPPGSVYAVIPASEFASGAALEGTSPTAAGPALEDDDRSQDGVLDGAGRVVSDAHELTYTTNPDGTITGHSPVGENLHGTPSEDNDDFTDLTIDFGFTGNASLSGKIWDDNDQSGSQNGGETGINWDRVIVESLDSNNNVRFRFVTNADANGNWGLNSLVAGRYRVTLGTWGGDSIPYNLTPTHDLDGTDTPFVATFDLAGGENLTNVDFGLAYPFTIQGYAFKDTNTDGYRDWINDPGRDNVTVNLRSSGGQLVQTMNTNSGGYYQFQNIPRGSYYIEIPATQFDTDGVLAGNLATPTPNSTPWYWYDENVGTAQGDGSVQSPVRELDNMILSNGSTMDFVPSSTNWSFGFIAENPASASGRVWHDLNEDGIHDTGEPWLENANVTIYQDHYDVVNNWWVWDNYASATTDANGYWSISGLDPGDWYIYANPNTGSMFQTNEPLPRGGNGNFTLTLEPNGNRTDIDFGFAEYSWVSGRVWIDANRDGVQDPDESPLENVSLDVCQNDENGQPYSCWGAWTDSDGIWQVGGIPSGEYTITVRDYQLPNGFDTPTFDLDGINTPHTAVVNVTPSGTTGVDFGYTKIAAIGDRVWFDRNHNGIDDGEPGMPDITVEMRRVSDDVVVATAVTDDDGRYRLNAPESGFYYVAIPWSQFDPSDINTQAEATANSVTDPTGGVDGDNNGYPNGGDGIRTGAVEAVFDPYGVGGDFDVTVDIGLWIDPELLAPQIQIEKFTQGLDGETAPGVPIKPGDPVKWTYKLTNVGDSDIDIVDFHDDKVGPLFDPDTGDLNTQYVLEDISAVDGQSGNNAWSPGESAYLSATGTAVEGPYENTATFVAVSEFGTGIDDAVTATDTSHYTGVRPGVSVQTKLNGSVVDDPADGPKVPTGSTLNWTFEVTNTGNYPGVFTVTNSMVDGAQIQCDLSGINEVSLRVGETDTCRATTLAAEGVNQMTTTATEDGIDTYDVQSQLVPAAPVEAMDASGYVGQTVNAPKIKVTSQINGSAGDNVRVTPGSTMSVTHTVTNTGNTNLVGVTLISNGNPATCPKAQLAVGESMVCTETVTAPPTSAYVANAVASGTAATTEGAVIDGLDPVTDTDRVGTRFNTSPPTSTTPKQTDSHPSGSRPLNGTTSTYGYLPNMGGPRAVLFWIGGGLISVGALMLLARRRRTQ